MARLVRAYVEHVGPHLERSGGTPDEPMQAAKGSSNPPVSDWVLGLMEANKVASQHIGWALAAVEEEGWHSEERIAYSTLLNIMREDPGILSRWRNIDNGNTDGLRAFNQMCHTVARGVMFVHGRTEKEREELTRRLDLDPDDPEALVVRRHPLEEEETRGRTRRGQVIDTMHTRRLMVEQLEQLEASTHYRGDEAIEVLAERKQREGRDWTFSKIRDAKTAVNKERREGQGEVA